MKILRAVAEIPKGRACLAIGVFDGVHLGHQQVIRQCIHDAQLREASAVVVTFDRHPNAVVAPDKTPLLIQTLPQKLRAIQSMSVDQACVIPFTPEFSRQPAEQFVLDLVSAWGAVCSVCVGSTFTFGHRRGGNVELLSTLGTKLGFAVHGLSAVSLDGERVSSSRIRECIRRGDLDMAAQLLGRPFALEGVVETGDGIGRSLGIPTANLNMTGMLLPPHGVYAGHVLLGQETRRAVLNIGTRPTLNQSAPKTRVELHVLDFSGDLYGQTLEIANLIFLRDERKFSGLEELKTQIATDIQAARAIFGL